MIGTAMATAMAIAHGTIMAAVITAIIMATATGAIMTGGNAIASANGAGPITAGCATIVTITTDTAGNPANKSMNPAS